MNKKTQHWIGAVLLLATGVLMIVGIFLLPAQVGMQISSSGELNNFLPKWLAILLPALIGGGCGIIYVYKKISSCAMISAIMIVVQIVTIVANVS